MKAHNQIFLGMLLGVVGGLLLWQYRPQPGVDATLFRGAVWWLDLFGPVLFIGLLKMLVAPLILASIVSGITSLPDLHELGAIGRKSLIYYAITTSLAALLGLILVSVIQPGRSAGSLALRESYEKRQAEIQAAFEADSGGAALDAAGKPKVEYLMRLAAARGEQAASLDRAKFERIAAAGKQTPLEALKATVIEPLLMNPFQSLVSMNSLGIIFFSALLGIALVASGPSGRPAASFFEGLNVAVMKITRWLMRVAPIAVMCIMAKFVAESGPDVFRSLGWYCGTVLLGLALHCIVLLAIAWVWGATSPAKLFFGFRETLLTAISTRSGMASLPVNIANCTENLGVSPKIANFALPLGTTINMNGTALYEGVAVAFMIQLLSGLHDVPVTLTWVNGGLIFLTAVLAAVGAAAVPSAGLVTMAMVAAAVGVPAHYIAIILPVDAFLDLFRTPTNVLGDAVGCLVVQQAEGPRLAALEAQAEAAERARA
ncbi:MAG: dicarboxylate/amino acid:cation symporter [Phycisphaerae bacterium]|nr:dicarboxylate/amino acid:cation symporter [Phycisphaerae bacterium]